MALARIKTWNPGDTLTAADLNAEFNNPLNNPISLVSPTTGAINFQTSVAHTNLQVSALTASSGFAGSVLITSTAATPSPIWSTGAVSGGVFVATTASIPTWLAVGTSGQLLVAGTSGAPRWGTLSSGIVVGSYSAGSTLLTLSSGVTYIELSNTVNTSVSMSTAGALTGQLVTMKFLDGNTVMDRNRTLWKGAVNFVSANNSMAQVSYDGANWNEISRSTNNG